MLLACVAKCLSVQVKYKEGARKVQRPVRLAELTLDGAGQPAVWRGEMTASVAERVLKLLHDMSEVGIGQVAAAGWRFKTLCRAVQTTRGCFPMSGLERCVAEVDDNEPELCRPLLTDPLTGICRH